MHPHIHLTKTKLMKTQSLLLLTLAFLAFSCKKDPPIHEPTEPVIPPLTHQGLNTFGCYIDGELFVANDGDGYWDLPALSGSFDEGTRNLLIQGTRQPNDDKEDDNIKLRADIVSGLSHYNFRFNEDGLSNGYRDWTGKRCDYYFIEYPDFDNGQLTITYLNEEKNIISGTFYINLVNDNCEGDTLMKITDGRFDFHY